MHLALRDRLLIRVLTARSAAPLRGRPEHKRALEVARVGAEHGIWHARLVNGERVVVAECERLELRLRAMMLEDGCTEEEAEAGMQELRRRRTAGQYRVTYR